MHNEIPLKRHRILIEMLQHWLIMITNVHVQHANSHDRNRDKIATAVEAPRAHSLPY